MKHNLMKPSTAYKPFGYPWAYEAWKTHEQMHWLPEEVPLAEDVRDWKSNLSAPEKNLLTQIFRFFTQADIDVANCYNQHYSRVFQPIEVKMMLSGFSARESIHVAAYSHLLDTVGMPEVEYLAFMKYKEMKDKHDYLANFNVDSPYEIAKTLAVFGAFTEGLQLFASFAMLMNFPRFNKMKGMGQIVAWSIRDEAMHCESVIKLFRTFIKENRSIWTDALKKDIYDACRTIVEHEDAFIDLAFELGDIQGMTKEDIKQYIRYIADRRLIELGLKPNYKVKDNPLPWLEVIINAPQKVNFFEQRVTEYSKASTKGDWDDGFENDVVTIYGQAGCKYCVKAKELCESMQVAYTYIDITDTADVKQELYDTHKVKTVPIVLVNTKLIGGFSELEEYLRGY